MAREPAPLSGDALQAHGAVYGLAYREAVRALAQQQAVFDSLRTRSGILLSAAAIATSFLGGAALADTPGALSWIAISLFALVGVATLLILWPRSRSDGLEGFVADPALLIANYVEGAEPLPLPLVHRDLALHMERSYDANEAYFDGRLLVFFRAACVLLVAEIVVWAVDLGV